MAGVNTNHESRGYKYYEIATSVRILPGLPPKKIFIRYIGKNPQHIDLEGIRFLTAGREAALDTHKKVIQLKNKIREISEDQLFSGPGTKQIKEQDYLHALATTINIHGHLGSQHLRWLREKVGVEDPTIYDLDKVFAKEHKSNNKISNAIMKLTSDENKEFFENLQEINRLKELIRAEEDRKVSIADMGGYGGAYDENKEDSDEGYKRDSEYTQDSVSGKIRAFKHELARIEHKNEKFEKSCSKELKVLEEYVRLDKINEIKLDIDLKFDHRHHINDVMEVYAEAKRYKALQIAKLKFNETATTDEQRVKFIMINEETQIESFIDLQNVYTKTFAYDFASDYLDKKLFNPIAMKTYENGNTKQFLNHAVKMGYLTKQFVEKEKGNTKMHYVPNFIDMVNEGKSNLLRKYSGISKASMARLVNHRNLDYVQKYVIEPNEEAQKMDRENKRNGIQTKKKARSFKQMLGVHLHKLNELGIRNKKEFAFMMSLCSQRDVRDSCRNALNIMKISEIYQTKEILVDNAKQVMKEHKKSKREKVVSEEELTMEMQMREFYGEDWKKVLGM